MGAKARGEAQRHDKELSGGRGFRLGVGPERKQRPQSTQVSVRTGWPEGTQGGKWRYRAYPRHSVFQGLDLI